MLNLPVQSSRVLPLLLLCWYFGSVQSGLRPYNTWSLSDVLKSRHWSAESKNCHKSDIHQRWRGRAFAPLACCALSSCLLREITISLAVRLCDWWHCYSGDTAMSCVSCTRSSANAQSPSCAAWRYLFCRPCYEAGEHSFVNFHCFYCRNFRDSWRFLSASIVQKSAWSWSSMIW